MDDYRDEIELLRREIAEQRAMVNAAYGATMTIIDAVLQASEEGGAVHRSELAKDLICAIAKAEGDGAEMPSQVLGRSLMRAFLTRLPKPVPRVVN